MPSRPWPRGIRARLLLLIAVVLLPLASLLAWTYRERYEMLRSRTLEAELEVATAIAESFREHVSDVVRTNLILGGAVLSYERYTQEKVNRLLAQAARNTETVRNFSWVGLDGRVLASSEPALIGADLSGRRYFRALRTRDWSIGDLTEQGAVTRSPTFAIAAVVRAPGGPRAVVVAGIEPPRLGEALQRSTRPAGGAYAIFDPQGLPVFHSPSLNLTWPERHNWLRWDTPLADALTSGRARTGILESPLLAGGRCICARVPIPELGWVAGTGRPYTTAMAPVHARQRLDAAFVTLVGLLALLAGWRLAGTIANPLRRLAQEAARVEGGGAIDPEASPRAPEEVRHLRFAVATMACNLMRRAEAMAVSEARFRQLADAMPQLVWTADADGRVDYYNIRRLEYAGISRSETGGYEWAPVVHEPDASATVAAWERALRSSSNYEIEHRVRRADGSLRWHLSRGLPVKDAAGRVERWFGTATDIHDLKLAQAELERALAAVREHAAAAERHRAQLMAVFRAMPAGLLVAEAPSGRLLLANPQVEALLGGPLPKGELLSESGCPGPEAGACAVRPVAPALVRALAGEATGAQELLLPRPQGAPRWARLSAGPVRLTDGRVVGAVAILADIDDERRALQALRDSEERFRHLADHDTLTGLPNRRLFRELAGAELARRARYGGRCALLYLDLDRFKQINDTLGHDAGDRLLVEAAGRLRQALRKSDVIARIGGDEFNILLPEAAHPGHVGEVAGGLLGALAGPFELAGHTLYISASIGIAMAPDDAEELESLLRQADVAMYAAKAQGRNRHQFFNERLNLLDMDRLTTESRLREGLARDELVLYYQPQVELRGGTLVGAEALVRWRHPEQGLIQPAGFIPIAEEIGLIAEIDAWVVRQACRQLASWRSAGVPPVPITVNLSGRQFQRPDLASALKESLDRHGVQPGELRVEVTETVAMADLDQAVARMEELTRLGVEIAIDDFGTGYSSLSYLKRMPVRKLKIDRSFVQDIADDPHDRAIIRAVTALAHSLDLRVIAEGVESDRQLSFLRRSHCDEAQGYLFNPPLPAAEFAAVLRG